METYADDTLFFRDWPQRIRIVIRYMNYKRFGAESTLTFGDQATAGASRNLPLRSSLRFRFQRREIFRRVDIHGSFRQSGNGVTSIPESRKNAGAPASGCKRCKTRKQVALEQRRYAQRAAILGRNDWSVLRCAAVCASPQGDRP